MVCREDDLEDCCCECCDSERQIVYTCLCMSVVVMILVVGIICWWAVDLSVFALNARQDGNGCSLRS